MNKTPNNTALGNLPSKQTGLSLIELMIASVIGLVVLGGAVTIFSGNNASSSMSSGMARLQDSGRVGLDIIANSVRMAGYEGCRSASKSAPEVIASVAPDINLPDSAIWGSETDNNGANSASWDPPAPAELGGITAANNTDVIYLQHGSGRSTNLNADMVDQNTTPITLSSNPDQLDDGDMIMISDCLTAHIFRATGVATNAGVVSMGFSNAANDRANLGEVYRGSGDMEDTALRIMRFESTAYFIGNSGRTTPGGLPVFSLFALDTTRSPIGNAVELIEGVEHMEILYGERLEASGDIRYVSADNVDNMNNVVSVQIGILIGTADLAGSRNDNRTYNLAGVTIGPPGSAADFTHAGDRRLRAAFNTTVQLRNRIPF